jgi:hypothetical protein
MAMTSKEILVVSASVLLLGAEVNAQVHHGSL